MTRVYYTVASIMGDTSDASIIHAQLVSLGVDAVNMGQTVVTYITHKQVITVSLTCDEWKLSSNLESRTVDS